MVTRRRNGDRITSVWKVLLILTTIAVFSPEACFCRTWYVLPDSTGDAPTIQAAIDSCVDGDSVLVAAGTYYVNLQIQSKPNLSLVSESGPEATILDGTYPANGAQIRWQVIRCQFSENASIEGFTIQEGRPEGMLAIYGGGILLGHGRVSVRNNIIQNNENDRGAAIGFGHETSGVEGTVIEENIIRWNMATDGAAGIHAYGVAGPIYIRNNYFTENSGDYAAVKALFSHVVAEGNVCMFNTSVYSCISGSSANVVVRRNIVCQNQGSGIAVGGGDIEDNTVVGNTQLGVFWKYGQYQAEYRY